MTPAVSLYLDAVRFLAAIVVFVGHVSGRRLTGGLFWQVGDFMDNAVVVFFVLSGFVIGYVTHQREHTAASYAINRLARIYSVALPALAATFLLDHIGRAINPAMYDAAWGYHAEGQFIQFLSGLTFTNQLWFWQIAPGSDLPFWSLGYEVWYYAIFAVAVFARHRFRWLGTIGLICLVGPRIVRLLPLWLLGVALYYVTNCVQLKRWLGFFLFSAAALAYIAYKAIMLRHGKYICIEPSSLSERYFVGLLFGLSIFGFTGVTGDVMLPQKLRKAVQWLAGATFSIYLFHLPVAQFLASTSPWPPESLSRRITVFGGTIIVLFAVAQVSERKKRRFQQAIASGLLVTAKLITITRAAMLRVPGWTGWLRSSLRDPHVGQCAVRLAGRPDAATQDHRGA